MLEITYFYIMLLGSIFVYKTLANDPEHDKIWGPKNKEALLKQKEKDIVLLKKQIDLYQNYQPRLKKESAREESMASR